MGRFMQALLCSWLRPQHFVILVGVFFVAAFGSAYAIAVSLGHVNALFPYISDTGSRQPESSVFGFFLSLGALAGFVCMYIRHQQFAELNCVDSTTQLLWNDVSLVLGFLIAIGILLVASFQESSVLLVHLIGAFLAFGLGVIYCWIHSYLTHKETALGTATRIKAIVRTVLAFLSTIFFLGTSIAASFATHQGKSKNETLLEWNSKDKGYDSHLVSTFSEWLMAISFLLYFFSFYGDFRNLRMHEKILRVYDKDSLYVSASSMPSPVDP